MQGVISVASCEVLKKQACSLGAPMPASDSGVDTVGLLEIQFSAWSLREEPESDESSTEA